MTTGITLMLTKILKINILSKKQHYELRFWSESASRMAISASALKSNSQFVAALSRVQTSDAHLCFFC
jgi:hypothetical protein